MNLDEYYAHRRDFETSYAQFATASGLPMEQSDVEKLRDAGGDLYGARDYLNDCWDDFKKSRGITSAVIASLGLVPLPIGESPIESEETIIGPLPEDFDIQEFRRVFADVYHDMKTDTDLGGTGALGTMYVLAEYLNIQ